MTKNLSETLQKPAHPIRNGLIAVGAIPLIIAGGLLIGSAFRAPLSPAPAAVTTLAPANTVPTMSASDLAVSQQAADAQQAQITATASAAATTTAPVATQPPKTTVTQNATAPKPALIKCPAGTKANAVDGAGNESNCQPLNSAGQSCQAYDNNNVCTAWGALSVWPLKP